MSFRGSRSVILFLLPSCLLFLFVRPIFGCLAEYRSPEWLVGHSPLIIIGTVEKVEEMPSSDKERNSEDWPGPSVATIRIDRILKGKYAEKTLKLHSGPIRSCADYPVHCHFSVGSSHIYILPFYPVEGQSQLIWGGSVRDLSDTAMVENRIAHAQHYRTEYLNALQKEKPAIYEAAQRLLKVLNEQSSQWPKPNDKLNLYEPSEEVKKNYTAVELQKYDPEAIRAVQAIVWLSDDYPVWYHCPQLLYKPPQAGDDMPDASPSRYHHPFWEVAVRAISETKKEQIEQAERTRIRKLLHKANVPEEQIEFYLNDKNVEIDTSLAFPQYAPGGRDVDKKNLTTDFIVRYHSYDRGMMVPAYAGDFDPSILAGLDPVQAKPYVLSLLGSDDERLHWLATRAIQLMPGTEYVDAVLDQMMSKDRAFAWCYLEKKHSRASGTENEKEVKEQTAAETKRRLSAMVDHASTQFTAWGRCAFWRTLVTGKCFEKICIEKAIECLEKIENPAVPQDKSAKTNKEEKAEDNNRLSEALREYLQAAMANSEEKKTSQYSAKEYRDWFAKHPKESEDE